MKIHHLPGRTAGAAENMATDFLLLSRYPETAVPRFRHYEWRTAAFTFGFSQKIAWVRGNLPVNEHLDLCRRPTGGGIVDHRNDWTYMLVLPRGDALYDERATQSYRVVHECLAGALQAMGQPAAVKTECEPCAADEAETKSAAAQPGVCFQRAELYDVINASTGAKVAGAAQKRSKQGLLFQGSIEKAALGLIDWDEFEQRFAAALGVALGAPPEPTPWPELNEDEVSGLIEQYSDPQWIEYR